MKLETISHPTVGAEAFCRASCVRGFFDGRAARSAYQVTATMAESDYGYSKTIL
jgi:hypothetical protein